MSHQFFLFLERAGTSRWRRAAACFTSLVVLSSGGMAAAQSTFIAFHSPSGNGDALGPKPSPPPLEINLGATVTLDLYVENFVPTGPASSGADVCVNGTGDEVCGWLLDVVGQGMRIDSFSPPPQGTAPISMIDSSNAKIKITGGSANGESGPVAVGALQVTVLAPDASLELSNGSSWLNAAGALQQPQVQVLAVSVDTCGNGTIEPPEQCDDANAAVGDGCFPSCRNESGFELTGTAQGGSIDVGFAERANPLVATTIAGESATVIAARVAMLIDDDPELSGAGRSAEASGTQMLTDATVETATSNDPGLMLVPEPSGAVAGLVGSLAVAALAIRRRGTRGGPRGGDATRPPRTALRSRR